MSRIYQLPDLIARCPKRTVSINENFGKLEDEYNKWVDSFPLFGTRERAGWKAAQIPLFVARCFPLADYKSIRAITDFMTVAIFLDKTNDKASVEEAEMFTSQYIAAFNDPFAGLEASQPFVKLVSSLALGATAVISEAYKSEFLAINAEYARATVQEAVEREANSKNVKLTLETYLATRRLSVALMPFAAYGRCINSLRISSENHNIKALEEAAMDMSIISNDIYSYKKELAEDDTAHNILTVIMQDPKTQHLLTDLQGAINHAAGLLFAALDRFQQHREALSPDKLDLVAYANCLLDIVVGGIEWEMVSLRYKVFETDADRENGVLRL
ncbi:hypothetical protein HYDPIDRAFT_44104 [Hydnomerulius pinastri MD-312]|uniref:Terpene synthase n=1 Tax=Hydnomerulius pinastri MD-312 TaxID=994086 RepID=A0A0C9W8C8_9AGAM|nr:hypothetical protein HYDPIDRAFT_44104 [Hydnomerulius pinastri MD-312]